MRIVCDTNILISALVFPGGPPDRILNLAQLGEINLCLSPDILTEFKKVLTWKFKYTEPEVDNFTQRLVAMTEMVYPKERMDRIRRKDSDNRILECAVEAAADCLVTGDKKDILPLKQVGQTRIITAAQFLEIWKQV